MAETWFGELKIPLLEHKIIIDYEGFNIKLFPEGSVKCNKFIFCGTVDKSRKFDDFIRLVDLLPADLKKKITIDIYGRGPNLSDHKSLVEQLGLDRILQFKRGIPQKELLQRYKDYDAGIAWVPTDKKFDCAASLKLVEYCAAGLVPIVTSTAGHRLSTEDGRFNVRFFNPNFQSFEKEIRRAVMEGMDARLLQENVKLAAPFDFSSVVKNNILPFYQDNIKKPQTLLDTVTPMVIKNNEVVIINVALEAKNLPKLEETRTDLVTLSSIEKIIENWITLVKKRWKSKIRPRFCNFSLRNKIGNNFLLLRGRLRTTIENQSIHETNQKALDELKKNLSLKERKNSFLEIELRKLLNKEIDKMTEIEFAKKEARFAITPARKISNGNEER
jgi:Fe-S cluster biosynthesis and repair protein YggX